MFCDLLRFFMDLYVILMAGHGPGRPGDGRGGGPGIPGAPAGATGVRRAAGPFSGVRFPMKLAKKHGPASKKRDLGTRTRVPHAVTRSHTQPAAATQNGVWTAA